MKNAFSAILIGAAALLSASSASASQTTWNITIDWGDWFNAYTTFASPSGAHTNHFETSPPPDGGHLTGTFVYNDSLAAAYYLDPTSSPPPIVSYHFVSTASNPGIGNFNPFPVISYDSTVAYAAHSSFGADIAFFDNTHTYILDLTLPDLTGLSGTLKNSDGSWQVGEFTWHTGSNPIDPSDRNGYLFETARQDFNSCNDCGPTNFSITQDIAAPNPIIYSTTITTDTPEPMSLALLGSGLLGLGALGRRFSRRK